MPSMGGSATLISAPHLGDLLDVDMSAKVDQSIPSWQAGAAKYEPLPGVVGDGASGMMVGGALVAGDQTFATEKLHVLVGETTVAGGQAVIDAGDPALVVDLLGTLAADLTSNALVAIRELDRGVYAADVPVLLIGNRDATGNPVAGHLGDIMLKTQDEALTGGAEINYAGGIGLFGATPPTARPAITGALSTVADAPAKDVLTSIIAALVGCGLASDGTT